MNITKIYCRASEDSAYSDSQVAKRIDDHLTSQFPAAFVAPDGIPQKENGLYEVRCFMPQFSFMIEGILRDHYGLEIVSVVKE